MPRIHRYSAAFIAVALCCTVAFAADEPPKGAASYAPTYVPSKANRIILLDAAQAGARVVTVGERGVVMQSENDGATWKALRTATTRTLTGVAFNDDKNGVAVGHGGVILRTVDAGNTWQLVKVAEAGVDSLLGVTALGGTRLVAYGAFGLYLETNDNGQTWVRHKIINADFDRHISKIFKVGDKFLMVGESATLASSDDAVVWTQLESPYKGSWFGGLATKSGAWLIYGMRGNVYRSGDSGANWTKIEVGGQQSLAGGRLLADGRVVLIGASGKLVLSSDDAYTFAPIKSRVRQSLSQVLPLASGKWLVVGEAGVAMVDPEATAK